MRYISLFLFVVVIGISSVAEGQEDIIDPIHHPDEMGPIVDILIDEFRSSIPASVEEHINEALNAAVEKSLKEAEQQRMELEQ